MRKIKIKQENILIKDNIVVQPSTSTPQKYHHIFFILLALIPFALLINMVHDYALNIPYMDDWDAVLKFLSSWVAPPSDSSKIDLLLSQHNEHRILSSRLFYVIYYSIFGNINFVHIIYAANIQLIVIASLLSYFAYKYLNTFWSFSIFIISISIFDPSNFENSNFAMAGMQNYGVIMLFLISLFFYNISSSNKFYLIPAILFQCICALSSGNGVFAGIALVFFNITKEYKLKHILISSITFLVCTFLYFLHYKKVGNDLSAKHYIDIIIFFFSLSGSHFGYEDRIITSVTLFIALAFCILYKNDKKYFSDSSALFSILLFSLLSMSSVALFRSGGKEGIDHDSYGSRYLIYPHIIAVLTFIFVSYKSEKFKIKWYIVSIMSLFFLKAYKLNYDYGEKGFNRENERLTRTHFYYPDTIYAKKISLDVCNKKIYCLDAIKK